MPKVLVGEPLPPSMLQGLRGHLPADVEMDIVPSASDEDLARHGADAEVLVSVRRTIDAPLLKLVPSVRFVQVLAVGYDNLDVPAIRAAGVRAANNPGWNSSTVAEHTVMLMLVLLRRFPTSEQATRDGRFPSLQFLQQYQPHIGELAGATVGLVGFGGIGQAVAERLKGFGSRVLYSARERRDTATEERLNASHASLPELLAASGILSLHLPLGPDTRNIIGEAELAQLRSGALLINTGRGGLVDEMALRRAIESGRLAGAALDVLEDEIGEVNPFADLPQVVVTPHIGGASSVSFPRALQLAAANITRFLRGESVHNLVV
jgi:glycerate dehydrogenase